MGLWRTKAELTEREIEVLARFVRRQTNAEIARDLALSVGTVKWYAQQIYNKLGVSDRAHAVARAQALGLLVETCPGELDPRPPGLAPHNLPAQFTSFIGREREIAQIRRLLLQTRLLTLTGPGGVGKTRLAQQSAAKALLSFPDDVFWVGLFALSNPELIINVIAGVLGVRESSEDPLLATVQRFLARRRLLLVLDNYEHLLPGVALIPALLTAAPNLRILVTSRELLHIISEQEYAVEPLDLPAADQMVSAGSVARHPATALFVQRAAAVKPTFMVTDELALVIAEICRRLDGLPLALELAAARCKLFTPRRCWTAWTVACRCSHSRCWMGRAGGRPCAAPSIGAMICLPILRNCSSTASASSPVAGRWAPLMRCAPICRRKRC